ncbi:MAG: T9SS type A sorting domain-containing protein [Bacteroidetes bacterium]|nr:T9SS type A sorting domain-containing protein [Bacteroidota bacterium]
MKKLSLIFLILLTAQTVFSQTEKVPEPTQTKLIESPQANSLVSEITKNIKLARENEDIPAKIFWENKLHEITKPQIITESNGNLIYEKTAETQSNAASLNLTTLVGSGIDISANGISREHVHGDIYAAVVINGYGMVSDTLKVFRSTNNGISFTSVGKLFSVGTFLVTANNLDIEAVSRGDSSFAFVGLSYKGDNFYSSSLILKVRQDGTQKVIYLPGTSASKFLNIRITSDNAKYISSAYIYAILTLDSNINGTRKLKTKLYKIESPYSSSISLTAGYQNPTFGQYSYNTLTAAPDTAKMESDVAYVNTVANGDLLCTVTIVRGVPGFFDDGKTLYFATNDNFGSTSPTLFSVTDGVRYKESPRLAATGLLNNSLVIIVRKLFGGTDWGPYCFWSPNIPAAVPPFQAAFVDNSPGENITLGVSVAANYRSNGSYIFSFSNRYTGGKSNIYTRPFYNLTLGTQVKSNPDNIYGSDNYGSPDAGFRNVNNDSCLVIWGGASNLGSYVTGGCSGPFIGINNNNSTPEGYYLAQNYPNPFNPSTSIAFEIREKGFVTLKVYDVLGNEVMQLVNEKKEAGSHVVQFDAKSLPSGTYFYKLTKDNFSDVKKMVLVK